MEKNRDKMFDTPDFEKKTLGKRRERRKNTLEGSGGWREAEVSGGWQGKRLEAGETAGRHDMVTQKETHGGRRLYV